MTELEFQAAFKRLAEDPDRWRDVAWSLRGAADAIGDLYIAAWKTAVNSHQTPEALEPETLERLTYAPPCLSLAGLAIENLAKAIEISKREPKSERGKLPDGIKGHGILHRLIACRIQLSDAERRFITRLEAFVDWAGRYPVPTNSADMDLELSNTPYVTDVANFRALFAKLDVACRQSIAEFDARKEDD